jgi:NTE family protein
MLHCNKSKFMVFFKNKSNQPLSLALQGGGTHGAFTWGVLDALLEDDRLALEGVSGTSAGAMNAVMLAQGLMTGGADGARQALADFWNAVARQNMGAVPGLKLMLQWTHYFSPEQLNPLDRNPLRDILLELVDFEQLQKNSPVKLYVAATHANSGKVRIFRNPEISVDAVLASACLPMMTRAVEIDGEPYWDGGYAANPAVFPLFYECEASDILLVLLSPLNHKETPHTAKDIKERTMELAFNATFLREMRMFAHAREYVDQSRLHLGPLERRIANVNFHLIEAQDLMSELKAETKIAADQKFFEMLRDQGRLRAKDWLQTNRAHVGKRSSVDLSQLFY